jgi:MFS superfamily sulfate permease-like transporter
VLGLRRVAPGVPGSLVAVAVGIVLVEVFSLQDHGVDIFGTIKSGLPTLGVPDVGLHDFGALAAGGIGVMLVGFAEGLGAAKTYAQRDHYAIDTNRELLGLGGANLASGLSSGMVVNGSLSKTGGQRLGRHPHAALGAHRRRPHRRHAPAPHRPVREAAAATLGRVPGTDQFGDVRRHPENELPAGIAVLRVESGLFFANADAVSARVRAAAREVHAVVLDAETVPFIDVTAAEALAGLAAELDGQGVTLALAALSGP